MKNSKERLIVALDVATVEEAESVIEELRDESGAFKIGLQLFTSSGPSFVRKVTESGAKVFLDLKFHDIPNTVACASVEAAKLGVWMFNVHLSGGREMLEESVRRTHEYCRNEGLDRPSIIGVTVLTSTDTKSLAETVSSENLEDRVVRLAVLASQCGLDGVVASANEADRIRRAVQQPGFLIVTPGIRPENATFNDQRRVMTPREAFLSGSDYIVVGRPILNANDRVKAARDLVADIDIAGSRSSGQSTH